MHFRCLQEEHRGIEGLTVLWAQWRKELRAWPLGLVREFKSLDGHILYVGHWVLFPVLHVFIKPEAISRVPSPPERKECDYGAIHSGFVASSVFPDIGCGANDSTTLNFINKSMQDSIGT